MLNRRQFVSAASGVLVPATFGPVAHAASLPGGGNTELLNPRVGLERPGVPATVLQ